MKMRIDSPTPAHISPLRCLWQEAFGDSDAFLDGFFDTAFSPDRCLCVFEEDLAAAVYWFDCRFAGRKIAYLYALATKKSHRGRGIARALMEETVARLQKTGYAGALLVPGAPELFAMYEKMGFAHPLTVDTFEAAAGNTPIALRSVTPEAYGAIRKRLLPAGAVVQEEQNLRFLGRCARLYAGEDWLLAANLEDGALTAMEFLGDRSAAAAVLAALGAKTGTFRTPGRGKIFALYRPITDLPVPTYFGLAFD